MLALIRTNMNVQAELVDWHSKTTCEEIDLYAAFQVGMPHKHHELDQFGEDLFSIFIFIFC